MKLGLLLSGVLALCKSIIMEVSVWDTFVEKEDGNIMHFDILVPSTLDDKDIILNYGKKYLTSKRISNYSLSSKECKFCHIEQATEEVTYQIIKNGFVIVELENCDILN